MKPSPGRTLRRKVVWAVTLTLVLLFISTLIALRPVPPRFLKNLPPGETYTLLTSPRPRPFSGGLGWIAARDSAGEVAILLFNVETGKIEGKFKHALPIVIDGNRRKVLCRYLADPPAGLWKHLFSLLRKSLRRPLVHGTHVYWILDLATADAHHLGNLRRPEIYSDPVPSPDLSRAYLENRFDGANCISDIRMFNLASPAVAHHQVPGWPAGWWDETHLLLKSANGGVSLYNLTTRQVRPLLSSRDLKAWLEQHQIRADIRHIAPFPFETEQRSRFYLTDSRAKDQPTNSFLARLNLDGSLHLLTTNFSFGWRGQFHPSAPLYLFTVRTGGYSNAIVLRNLETGIDRMVVPKSNNRFSWPAFHQDQIIYTRNRLLLKTDLHGSNTIQLFPPKPN